MTDSQDRLGTNADLDAVDTVDAVDAVETRVAGVAEVPGGPGGTAPRGDEPVGAVTTPARRALRRFVRNPVGMVAFAFLVFVSLVAIFAPWLMPREPSQLTARPFEGPGREHWLGTDDLGRDLASRLMIGARVSLRAAFQTVAMALVIAVPVGLVAGYFGGKIDNVLLRLMDALMSFPPLVLALVIAAVLGPSLGNAMIAITIVLIPSFVRVIRGQALAVSQETFVEASKSIGTRTHVILARRVLPSVLSPLIVAVSLVLGLALVAEAALSFLGLGVQSPETSWGSMLGRSSTSIFSHPYQMMPAGLAIALTVLAFNSVGDSLRDALGLAETAPPKGSGRARLGMTLVHRPDRQAVVGPHDGDRSTVTTITSPRDGDSSSDEAPVLSVRDLSVEFATSHGPVTVVDRVSFDVRPGEVVGLVGESGSGKSVTSLSIMRLLPSPPARITSGEVLFEGHDLLDYSFEDLRRTRGDHLSMVFQDPMSSLNPAFTIGNQLAEAVRLHHDVSRSAARARALELLELVGIPDPTSRLAEYPHRLSGGMRQRVLIAMALINNPKLVIADEPTTALDVTVQAQILDLLRSLQQEFGMAIIFVTHDLGVVADLCDRVAVMYAGQVVEQASVHELFANPRHPYTERLLTAIPQATPRGERLASIPGVVPVPGSFPVGCRFSARCPYAVPRCDDEPIPLAGLGPMHSTRCIRHHELHLGRRR